MANLPSYEDAKCVVTIGEGKHYCLGLDLEYLAGCSMMESYTFSETLQKLMLRILTFPLVTVAAINGEFILHMTHTHTPTHTHTHTGHVYAGGVFLAIAHDYTIMRSEKGWFCLSEVHLKRNFTAGFLELGKWVTICTIELYSNNCTRGCCVAWSIYFYDVSNINEIHTLPSLSLFLEHVSHNHSTTLPLYWVQSTLQKKP